VAAEDREVAVLPEAAAEQRVSRLVRDDPRHLDVERRRRVPDDRERHEHDQHALGREDGRNAGEDGRAGRREGGGGPSGRLASLL
jgi:hypothetical protein